VGFYALFGQTTAPGGTFFQGGRAGVVKGKRTVNIEIVSARVGLSRDAIAQALQQFAKSAVALL